MDVLWILCVLCGLAVLGCTPSAATSCTLDFHTEASHLMVLHGQNTSITCDATSCLTDQGRGDSRAVVWTGPSGLEISGDLSCSIHTISNVRPEVKRLVFIGAERAHGGTYTCTYTRNGVVEHERAVRLVVMGGPRPDNTTTAPRPRRYGGRRRGDILLPQERRYQVRFRPVRSAPRSDLATKPAEPRLEKSSFKRWFTQFLQKWADRDQTLGGRSSTNDLSFSRIDEASQELDKGLENSASSNGNAWFKSRPDSSTRDVPRNLGSPEMKNGYPRPQNADVPERDLPSVEESIMDLEKRRSSRVKEEGGDSRVGKTFQILPEHVYDVLGQRRKRDVGDASTTSSTPLRDETTLGVANDVGDGTTYSNETALPSETITIVIVPVTSGGGDGGDSNTTTDDATTQPPQSLTSSSSSTTTLSTPSSTFTVTTTSVTVMTTSPTTTISAVSTTDDDGGGESGATTASGGSGGVTDGVTGKPESCDHEESFFGRGGLAVFAIAAGVAVLLLYALFMIVALPKIMECCNKGSKGDSEKVAVYKKRTSGIVPEASVALFPDSSQVPDSSHAHEETTANDNQTFDLDTEHQDDATVVAECQPAVSTFLLRQNSLLKEREEREAREAAEAEARASKVDNSIKEHNNNPGRESVGVTVADVDVEV